jgi:hypothetical protein
MAIITISRGSYSKGKEIAEAVANRLGYDCISREILIEASEHFKVPEIKLVRALHDAPSLLERFGFVRERYMAFIQSELLSRVRTDNVVYHGLAGHILLRGVAHCLKVRILADMNDRIRWEMERENISAAEARRVLEKDDEERRRWTMALWHKDPWDPSLYDLVVHIDRITASDAVDIICNTVQLEHFSTTEQSRKTVEALHTASRVKAAIAEEYPSSTVTAQNGTVFVSVPADLSDEPQVSRRIHDLTQGLPALSDLRVSVNPPSVLP